MHGLLSKALIILTLWSGTGLALTGLQISQATERGNLSCLAGTSAAPPCASYAEAVTAALAAD